MLYWRDVLHEGPVPAVGPEELRRIRAGFLVGQGVDDQAEAERMFLDRGRTLEARLSGLGVSAGRGTGRWICCRRRA
ncbi:hypothetical protein ACWD3I_43870 [Streptomyces sp. NPDC002817]|uniref:hypothetical protein n=1 Tax=Streptomyces sp. NPDC088357 TaxID=3154655 RepID=UPI0034386DCF